MYLKKGAKLKKKIMMLMVSVDQISAWDIFHARTFLVHNNHQNERNCLMSNKKITCICLFI